MVLKALLGPHKGWEESDDKDTWNLYRIILESGGYKVEIADSVGEMLEYLGVQDGSPITNHYDFVIMETNQGNPGGESYEPAETIYAHIRNYNEKNTEKIEFMAVSNTPTSVIGAKSKGIPAMDKTPEFKVSEIKKLMKAQ